MRVPPLIRLAVLPALVAAAVLAGCGSDDNPVKPGPSTPTYPILSSPQNVLLALGIAYSYRDSVEYRKLYDYDYVGTSEDLLYGTNDTFRVADEIQHIQALAQANTVINVTFDMGSQSNWVRLQSDDLSHPEWALIQLSGSNYRVIVYDQVRGDLTASGSTETMTFTFKPLAPDSTSPTDTLWNIIRWEEVRAP